MRNVLSKGILAVTLIAGPAAARGESPATSPTTPAANQGDVLFTREPVRDLQARQAALDEALAARKRAAEKLTEMRQHVQDLTGLVEVTPEAVRQIISRLQEQREALELDGAGAEGRRQALEEAVAVLSRQLKERAQTDAVATTLEKVVDVRRAQLQRVQELNKEAVVARSEVEAAEAGLAQAQAEVAAAQQKAAGGMAAEPLDAWNRQLLELGIAEREREARLKFINKRLEQFSAALSSVDQMEEQRAHLAAAESEFDVSVEDVRQFRRWEVTPRDPSVQEAAPPTKP